MGRKGRIAALFEKLPSLSGDDRKVFGQKLNALKQELSGLFSAQIQTLSATQLANLLTKEKLDVTLPGEFEIGNNHPITLVMDEVVDIFMRLGYTPVEGPEVETEFYNFDALNIPKDHPARDMHDTFYLNYNNLLLRTHTSPVQIRHMEKVKPPLAIVVPGRVYRCDADVSHSPMFHQVEGLLVDKNVSFADLKGTITYFLQSFFGEKCHVRFRPSFFPFTEPSAEVDVECVLCDGKGCQVCKESGWLEVMGCGMVHPNVFRCAKVDPKKWTGLAFGMGIERLAMLRYHMDDIRVFFENDMRFLRQFG